jgi:putative hydrolase
MGNVTTSALNEQIADRLAEVGDLLEQQGANPFRVHAYRRAAETVMRLDRDAREILEREGVEGLVALPGIGRGIAGAILELVARGRWSALERLRGELDPVQLFRCVPGIGPALAGRIHDALHVDSLEGLEAAAHDGRLEGVPDVGPRRAKAIRTHLASVLGRVRTARPPARDEPDVTLVLSVDEEYRRKAAGGELTRIAPKRFNPEHRAWLPVLHAHREGWHFSVLFSNTARAHELGRTDDWVVVYFYDDDHQEGQCTVVTETRGALAGRRVVRGREQACRRHYAHTEPAAGEA